MAGNVVFRSTDLGSSWEAISPDLTRHDPSTLEPSGGPITKDTSGAEVYATIFAFVESPHQPGVFWAGSDDGLVHLSRDGGGTWDAVTPDDLLEWTLICMIEVSPHDPATAYIAATRYKLDDTRPMLYRTTDYGQTWTSITAGLPEDDYTRVVREDPARPGLLYAGTETGVYVSFDQGDSWQPLRANLPVVPVYDLAIKDDNLVAATHGRSFWILDDLTQLRQLAPSLADQSFALLQPRDTYRIPVALPGPDAQFRKDLPRRPGRGRHLQRIAGQGRRDCPEILGRRRKPARRGDDPLPPAGGVRRRGPHHPGRSRGDRPDLLRQTTGSRRGRRGTPGAG